MNPLVPTLIMGHDRVPIPLPFLYEMLAIPAEQPAGATELWTAVHIVAQAGELGGALVDKQLSPRPLSQVPDPLPEAGPEWTEQFELAIRLDLDWAVAGAIKDLANSGKRLPLRVITRTLDYLPSISSGHFPNIEDIVCPQLPSVLGERGRAVLQQNARWREALSTQAPERLDFTALTARWEEAESWPQQRDLLTAHQDSHPDWAQSMLPEIASLSSAAARAGLLATYQGGKDPSGFEVFREDRSKKVRDIAGDILQQTPGTPENDRVIERVKEDLTHDDLDALTKDLDALHPDQLEDVLSEQVAELAQRDDRLALILWTMVRENHDVDLMIKVAGRLDGHESPGTYTGITTADLDRLLPELRGLAQIRALMENLSWPSSAPQFFLPQLREYQSDSRDLTDHRASYHSSCLSNIATTSVALLDAEHLAGLAGEYDSLVGRVDERLDLAITTATRGLHVRHRLHQLLH